MVRPSMSFATSALAGLGLFVLTSACTERARSSDFDPKNAQPTVEAADKIAEPEAREPDSIQYSDNGPAAEIGSVKLFANTRGIYLKDLRGKYVLMQIFTLGKDSLAERKLVQRYNAMHKSLSGKGNFQLLTVLTGTDVKSAQQLLERANRLQVAFPVALDATGQVAEEYKAASLPATYLIDPDGKIVFTRAGVGGTDYTENAVRQKLNMPLIPERD